MKTLKQRTLIFMSAGAFALIAISTACTEETPTEDVQYGESTGQGCTVNWSDPNSIPEPNYATFPIGYSVDSTGGATNLAFHEISWQYFLWLTQTVTTNGQDQLRFETMYNDAAINPDESDPTSHVLGGILQAGSNSILLDENGRAVYTTMMIDSIYRQFAIDNKLYTKEGMENVDPNLDFPPGALSLKAAWKIVPEGKEMPGYYTKEATLYTVIDMDGQLVTSDHAKNPADRKTFKAKVALIGLHIAVVLNQHPEFVWATFENNKNAPNFSNGSITPQENFTFYDKGTGKESCNRQNQGALQIDPATQVISLIGGTKPLKTEVFRMHEFGGGKESNQTNIKNLNDSVQHSLGTSIWANYHEVGAVWFDADKSHGKLYPNWSPTVTDTMITGSLTLSSAVIETFTQDPKDANSCFACHNTSQVDLKKGSLKGANVLTSHILLQNYLDAIKESDEIVPRTKRTK